MQIRAIISPSTPLPPLTHTSSLFPWVMKFVWLVFSHSLCQKLTMNGPNHAALPRSFSTSELNINAAWQQ